jgi:exodeoxyribonuclease VII small subunit
LAQLERIVHELEEGQIGLAEALARYEQGVSLLRQCHAFLERAERKIELLCEADAAGNAKTTPFDDQAAATLEEKADNRSQNRSRPPVRRPAPPVSPQRPASQNGMDGPNRLF